MLVANFKRWEDTGLLIGLSDDQKFRCAKAFDRALIYLLTHPDNRSISNEERKTLEDVSQQVYVSIDDLKRLFINKIELSFEIILFPMIRRIITREIEFDLLRFISHCQKEMNEYDFSKLPKDCDVEAELCAYLSDTFN